MTGIIVEGDPAAVVHAYSGAFAKASVSAMRDVVGAGKQRLRADILQGFRAGEKLAKTWRANAYPDRANAAFDPAGVFESKAPEIVDAFSHGVTIHAENGKWLAVPAPKYRRSLAKLATKQNGGEFAGIGGWPTIVATSLGGKPKFFILPGGRRGIVYVSTKAGGRRAAAGKRQVIGWLVKQAVLGKRIRGPELLADIGRNLPGAYQAAFETHFAAELGRL